MIARRPLHHLAAALAAALALAACGADVEEREDSRPTALVQRCGEQVRYTRPERAVAYEGGSADKLFALGLADRVHGYVLPPANPPVSESPWAADYRRVRFLGDDLLNREQVVAARADLVVAGWNSGFKDERGITPEILDRLGIQSFMHAESCFNYPGAAQTVAPFEGLYTDLRRLGAIFGVPDRAERLVAGYRERVAAVRASAPRGRPTPVFVYDSGTAAPLTTGNQVPAQEIVGFAGGRNVFSDLRARYTEASWEAVADARPEVVVIIDYGDQTAAEKIAFLKRSPRSRDLPAVRRGRFFVLDYNEAISGPRNVVGLERFGRYLRELRG